MGPGFCSLELCAHTGGLWSCYVCGEIASAQNSVWRGRVLYLPSSLAHSLPVSGVAVLKNGTKIQGVLSDGD